MSVQTIQIDRSLTITIVDDFVIAYMHMETGNYTFACELHVSIFSRSDGRSSLPDDIVAVCKEAIINKKISSNYIIRECIEVSFECIDGRVSFVIGDCRDVVSAFISLKKYLAR